MTITTLQDKITKANEKIGRKQQTIEKMQKLIEKKNLELAKLGYEGLTREKWYKMNDQTETGYKAYWTMCDIEHAQDSIEDRTREIAETKKTIEKYEAQLAGEIERESILIKEIPESMKEMQAELVTEWDAWDIERRNRIKDAYKSMDYKTFTKKHTRADYEFMHLTDDQIHNTNLRDAKMLIINLYYRVREITGDVTDWKGIRLEKGNMGAVLNGQVIGKEGIAYVESILAGGYNIQRLHVRTLVHSI